ncbi:MAG: hypothetical protein M1835_006535 [Candelina submexicana]|nr:MAG: hypothetical protein M1835_006535 [Candelina submexicana]
MAAISNDSMNLASSSPAGATAPTQHQLPSIDGLTNGVPAQGLENQRDSLSANYTFYDPTRDSGNWSLPSTQSKHNSAASVKTNSYLPPMNSSRISPQYNSYGSDDRSLFTPSYQATSPNDERTHVPRWALSSDSPNSNLPQLNKSYEGVAQKRSSNDFPSQSSRRSSVDTSIRNNMSQLVLGGNSPYGSANASQASLVSDLQRERGIPTDQHRLSNGLHPSRYPPTQPSPLSPSESKVRLGSSGGRRAPAVAPPIMPATRTQWPNPNAKNPTPGAPYAFPDPTVARSSSGSDDQQRSPRQSRRASLADSIGGSSIFTTDSRMPPGQKRLDDDLPGVHHHQLQHRHVSGLSTEAPESPSGPSPYSRTPELRVSHKLAERKRRSEMKDLFSELDKEIPAHRNNKSSKWETLSKAVEHIRDLKKETKSLRAANTNLTNELNEVSRQLQHYQQGHQQEQQPQQQQAYAHFQTAPLPPANDRPRAILPPLLNGITSGTKSSSMQGIQYSN